MKRLLTIVFLFSFLQSVWGNDKIGVSIEQIFNEGKNVGYKMGYETGYIAGYKEALEYFKTLIQKYKIELDSLDAGRILLKEWYISYPQVYQVMGANGLEIRVLGCKPVKPLSEEILSKLNIPPMPPQSVPLGAGQFQSYVPQQQLPDNESLKVLLRSEVNLRKPIVKKVSKRYLQEVQRYGYPYELTEQDKVSVYFQTEAQAQTFCLVYQCE